jgi:PPOX class probable F420-dependent enzyme
MSSEPNTIIQKPWVQAFLAEARLARLATCNPHTLQPHVVPVWYEWDGESIWISSFHSTRKVGELKRNPLASLIIDIGEPGEVQKAVLIEGTAELITDPDQGVARGQHIYSRYLGEQGALAPEPQSWLHDPQHLLIKLTPQRIYTWGE